MLLCHRPGFTSRVKASRALSINEAKRESVEREKA